MILDKDKDGQLKLKIEAFASKTVTEGSLFKRIIGKKFAAAANTTTSFDFTVPYNKAKVEAIEIINGDLGDHVTFKVLDSTSGKITGVPNYLLNTFGETVYMDKSGYYEQRSQYDADVSKDLQFRLEFYNNGAAKDVYINYILNEVK